MCYVCVCFLIVWCCLMMVIVVMGMFEQVLVYVVCLFECDLVLVEQQVCEILNVVDGYLVVLYLLVVVWVVQGDVCGVLDIFELLVQV